ncbi:MAG TPA: helix-turn-helix domain-containing protein [Ilumatobacter sp.]|nr:helix-turn-helix domain-containing protein [Ilumatobacter sp.]
MSDVMEVQPGTLDESDLDALQRALAGGEAIELPERLHAVLEAIVKQLQLGNGVSVVPLHAQLTTFEAADILNVSRPFLIKRIEAGEVPFHMVGTHRRLKLSDVLAYRDRLAMQADDALAAMTAEAEELGLYD